MSEPEYQDTLEQAMRECAELRSSLGDDSIDEGPAELHEKLLKARKALDRMETHVAYLGKLHARLAQVAEERRHIVEDAEAQAIDKMPNAQEFATAKERNARLTLATLVQRRDLRKVEKQKADFSVALEYCRTLHRGMDSTRRDLDTRIRLISMQTSLER